MKSVFRFALIPAIVAMFVVFTPARPASAAIFCTVSSGTLASGANISVTAPAGHTYVFSYTGAATGQITVTGTLNIVNGTGGVLNYVITDENADCTPGGPGVPAGFVERTITCSVAVYDAPGGSPVGSNAIVGGQTWYVNPTPKTDAAGKSWTEIFVAGPSDGYVPTSCVR